VADSLSDAIKDPTDRRVTEAMKHFAISYGAKHSHPPFWLAAEAFSFGNLVTAYKASPAPIRKAVARGFSISEPVFESWLLTLHTIRNVCAHHCRIWNRKLGTQPMLPQKVPLWNLPELGRRDRIFYSITVLAYCMSTLCDASTWGERFRKLVEETHPHIPTRPMGIGNGWKEHVVWNHSLAGLTGPVPIGAQPRGA
jgi:abortive infection bacteriophage resistance protein